jgi:acyl-CoA reductase-like NAD-dependent aldehyde dehydrogenase
MVKEDTLAIMAFRGLHMNNGTCLASNSFDRIERARAAQRTWASQSVKRRLRPIKALRHRIVDDCANLCAAVAADLGKTIEEVIGGDLLPLAGACRFLEQAAVSLLRPRKVPRRQRPLWLLGQRDWVERRPRGVIGIIGTWNYPLFLSGGQIVQAVTAGNAVLWKPSEVAPRSAQALIDLLGHAGFPADLIQMLEPTRTAGQELTSSALDHVVFTGSAETGRVIARHLGERLISSTLELSGCDAQFVLDDADVALAARAAWFGATLNRGQTCIAVRRAFVQRSIYPAFCAALRGLQGTGQSMALALEAQARQAERLVHDAVAAGGQLLGAGAPGSGQNGCRPAVVLDAHPDMALCQEAAFAPVLAVLPFDHLEEALRMEAQCHYALGASIFSGSLDRAREVAAQLRTGMVTVNDVIVPTAHPATPFGGNGASGWGVTQGAEGLLEMTVPRVVSIRSGRYRPHYDLASGGPMGSQEGLLRGMLEHEHGRTFGQRWRGLWKVLRALLGKR